MLYAKVVDEVTEFPIVSAKITVADTMGVTLCDSIGYHSYEGFRNSYEQVLFTGHIPMQAKYKIKISAKGYETQLFNVTTPEDRVINLGTVYMNPPRRELKLNEVTVTASKIKMVMRGDTLEYDATAFQLQEGSMLDGLIAALPGATLDNNGRITVNGRFVSELLVNGRNFFSGDPQVALRNLPAYTVKKVQVYQKTPNEFRNIKNRDSSNDPLVMDINLKKDYMKGWLANVEGGYGSGTRNSWSARWLGRFFAMRYDKYSYIALHSSANNLNDPEAAGSKGQWRKPQATSGEITTKRIGIEYNTDWHDQEYAGINTKLNLVRQNTFNTIDNMSEAYLAGGNSFSRSSLATKRDTWQGNWYFEASRNFDTKIIHRIWVNANLVCENGKLRSKSHSAESGSMLPDNFASAGSAAFVNNMLYLRQHNSLLKEHSFAHTYRVTMGFHKNFSFSADASFRRASSKTEASDLIYYPNNPALNLNRILREDTPSHQYFYQVNPQWMLYSEHWNVSINYTFRQEFHHGERTLDELNDPEETNAPSMSQAWAIDYANSYRTTRRQWTHTFIPDILFRWGGKNGKDYSLHLYGSATLDTRHVSDFRNLIPHSLRRSDWLFDGRLTIAKGSSWWGDGSGLILSAKQMLPDVMQLLNIRDSSNPLVIELGNPDLSKSTRYEVSAFFRKDFNKGARSTSLSIAYWRTEDALARARTFDRVSGVTTWRPVNINGNRGVNGEFFYSAALLPGKKLNLINNLRPAYARSADFSSDSDLPMRSEVDNWTIRNDFSTNYNLLAGITLSAKVNLAWTSLNSRSGLFQTFDYVDINYGIGVKYTLPGGVELDTDLMAYSRRGYEDSTLNTTDWVWNLQLSKTFGSAKQFTVKAIGFDLLHQLPTVKQVVNAQGRTETRYNSQPAYAILTMTYRLDIKPRKK